MSRNPTITAVDIGTSSFKAMIVQKKPEEAGFKVLGKAENVSSGMRRGVVSDPERAGKVIYNTLQEAQREAGQEVEEVYANINGSHLFSVLSRGLVSVSRADREIAQGDVDRAIEAAKTFSLPSNKEILEIIPREFIVDKERGVRDPLGLHGVRLETEILAIGGFAPYSRNLTQSILNANLQVKDLVVNPLAVSRAVLTQEEKELGVAVIDIGAGTTGLTVFEENDLLHMAVLPVGMNNVRNDIAIGLKIDIETAEFVKNKFGASVLGERSAKKEKIKLPGGGEISFARNDIRKIGEARFMQIFEEIEKELKKISRHKLLPGGVVLTGGGAKLPHLADITREKLGLPCRIGVPRRFFPLDEDPSLTTLCGLILYGMELEEEERGHYMGGKMKGVGEKMKRALRVFIP